MVGTMRIGITGASGLVGSALSNLLGRQGHEVVALVRRDVRDAGEIRWDPSAGTIDVDAVRRLDAIVHLAGAGIGDHRWTDDYKRTLVDSRVQSTSLLASTLAAMGDDGPRTLISGSAVGYYGDRGDEVLDEASTPGEGFLADLCRSWEAATAPAESAGVRVAHIRTGLVLTVRGGALKKMLPLFRLGAGGRFGNGRQWMSWISIDDAISAIAHLLTSGVSGPVNLTAPGPVRNSEFARTLGDVLKRPSRLPVPPFGPRLLLGGELANALLFDGQRVVPRVLQSSGFRFQHPDLPTALRAVLAT